jgi:type II secretory pathway predicted ATPase ExeA
MFEGFYGFTATPFCRGIPVPSLYRDRDRDEIVGRLKYAAKNQMFALLSGESGVGKTTILRRLSGELPKTEYTVIYLSDSRLTPRLFYKEVLGQLGYDAKYFRGDAKTQLFREIEIMKAMHGVSAVVIVDESHLLGRDMLEEVRFLLNIKMDSASPISLILSAQSELREKLRCPGFAAIRQRVDIQCNVGTFDLSQTMEYVKTHLAYAGCGQDIFTEAAIEDIFKFSGGISRLVNKACSASLLYGAQNSKALVDDRMVKFVIESELS